MNEESILQSDSAGCGSSQLDVDLMRLSKNGLEIKIAKDIDDIKQSQALRYHVFYEELNATPLDDMALLKRDYDQFDKVADHLLVIDHNRPENLNKVIGTYRLLRRESAKKVGRFYSIDEFDISQITNSDDELLELGRSCVHVDYRTRNILELLWRGIAAYTFHYNIQLFFGCASFHGTNIEELAPSLSLLHQKYLAPENVRPKAVDDRYLSMDILQKEEYDERQASRAIPPLLKGYLRLGAWVGDGAVIDKQFNTTDIMIIIKTEKVTKRYYDHYARRAGMDNNDHS